MIKKNISRIINIFNFKAKHSYENFDSFWLQKIETIVFENRFDFFQKICNEKDVIHFGCTDWPIFNPSYNLHIALSKVAKNIHGFDIDIEGIENLKKYVNQEYFSNFDELKNREYDVCIVPETIEHVDNARIFLEGLSTVNAKVFYITAPNCFAKKHIERNFYGKNEFIEVVHPDHNCWYSPYTLKNQIEKYSNLNVTNVFLLNGDTMVCCQASKKITDKK